MEDGCPLGRHFSCSSIGGPRTQPRIQLHGEVSLKRNVQRHFLGLSGTLFAKSGF